MDAALRFVAPTAAAAFVLTDLLSDHGATAQRGPGGTWEVEVPLGLTARETVPTALAAARNWLELCGLASATVSFDGHSRTLRNTEPAIMQ